VTVAVLLSPLLAVASLPTPLLLRAAARRGAGRSGGGEREEEDLPPGRDGRGRRDDGFRRGGEEEEGKKWVPKRVANFDFDNLPVTCDPGSFTFSASSGTDRPPFPVQGGLFEFLNSPTSVAVELTRKGKQATGLFERSPAPLDGETNCFTPELSWSAQKTGTHQTLPRL
jgi:hypothetical protein